MLFRLNDDLSELEPMPFADFARHALREKHLEELLSRHLFGTLFEGTPLLPFHQERNYQPEGDIYALDRKGDVFVFELKRGTAEDAALAQLLRYAQGAGRWSYADLDRKYRAYPRKLTDGVDLAEAHRQAFDLAAPLRPEEFNRDQHMVVVGSAADAELVQAVDYWKGKGLSIDFCPYRVYQIGGQLYFEFFARPYDAHANPGDAKGVLFDTCRTHFPDALRHMVERRRVSAFGDRKDAVYSLGKGDTVFYSHVGVGLVAAAKVVGSQVKSDTYRACEERYWDVQFFEPVPAEFSSVKRSMPFQKVTEFTGKKFFWARIQKVPYLSADEAGRLLAEVQKCLAGDAPQPATA